MSTHGPVPHPPKALPAAAVRHRAEDEAVARKTLALARQGVAFAQCSLGKLYQRGAGLSQDLEQAVYWYQAASQQGNSEAQFLLGLCRQEGKGSKKMTMRQSHFFAGLRLGAGPSLNTVSPGFYPLRGEVFLIAKNHDFGWRKPHNKGILMPGAN